MKSCRGDFLKGNKLKWTKRQLRARNLSAFIISFTVNFATVLSFLRQSSVQDQGTTAYSFALELFETLNRAALSDFLNISLKKIEDGDLNMLKDYL